MPPRPDAQRLFPVAELQLHGASGNENLPVQFGVPLPEGWCSDARRLVLVHEDGQHVEAAIDVTARWPDQSIQWCLVHCRPEGPRDSTIVVGVAQIPFTEPAIAIADGAVIDEPDRLRLLGASRQLTIPKDVVAPLHVVDSDDRPCLLGFLHLVVGATRLTAAVEGYDYRTRLGSAGVISREVKLRGRFGDDRGRDLRLHCALCISADGRRIDGRVALHNAEAAAHPGGLWDLGDPASLRFDALELGFVLPDGEANTALQGTLRITEGGDIVSFSRRAAITQYASGGDNWDSPNHVDASGEVSLSEPGYIADVDGRTLKGRRATPRIRWQPSNSDGQGTGPSGPSLSASLPHFWQNFPTAIEATPQRLSLQLFTNVGKPHELQPGERKSRPFTLLIDASPAPDLMSPDEGRIVVVLDTAHIQRCAIPLLGDFECVDARIAALSGVSLDPQRGFFAKREAIDEYGWRHFGDLWADHETEGYTGERPFVSHYNNQYDPLLGFLRRFMACGDPRWFELADDLARHLVDIDIYRTSNDRSQYNHGLFWHTDHYLPAETATHRSFSRRQSIGAYEGHAHGGGPGGQHCYTTGLLVHYLLTGCEDSREAVFGLQDWISCVYEGSGSLLDVALAIRNRRRRDLKNQLTGQYPLDRGVANYLHAILDCHVLEQRPSALARVDAIVRATLHPADDIESRDLRNVEDTWYYVVFLQALCRFLRVEHQWQGDSAAFRYARDALLHYADWIVQNEAPYLDRPEILEFPNKTWAAQDLRKANVLFEAARWAPADAARYTARARHFVEYVVSALQNDASLHYTRIQALLLQNLDPTQQPATPRETAATSMLPPRGRYEPPVTPGVMRQAGTLLTLTLRAMARLRPGEELRALRRLLPSRKGDGTQPGSAIDP
jgi:hypothetical protein